MRAGTSILVEELLAMLQLAEQTLVKLDIELDWDWRKLATHRDRLNLVLNRGLAVDDHERELVEAAVRTVVKQIDREGVRRLLEQEPLID
jgi:hypothetical protein